MTISTKNWLRSRRLVPAFTLTMLLSVLPSIADAADKGRVGVVDFGEIIKQLPDTKEAEATLQETAAPLQQELARLNSEYQKAISAYLRLPATTSAATKKQNEQNVNSKALAVRRYRQEQGLVVEKKQQELLAPVREKILSAVKVISEQEGLTLVLDKGAQVYGTPEHDLTLKVMNQLQIRQ